jgi:hypothetical protein
MSQNDLTPPVYHKQIYSGLCVCSHSANRHHGAVVGNPDYVAQTQEYRIAGACLYYGANESTDAHCPSYWDVANPFPDPDAAQRPTPPSLEVRSRLREWRHAHLDETAPPLRSLEQWRAAAQNLQLDGDAVSIDQTHVLRLSLGDTDHGNEDPNAPYFHRIALHIDRYIPSDNPTSRYDTWWLEAEVVNSLVPFPDDLDVAPLPDDTLASILAELSELAAQLFLAPSLGPEPSLG